MSISHELNEIYIDETAQSGHRYLVLGGIVFPQRYSAEFERAVLDAREPNIPAFHKDGRPIELGWNEFTPSRHELDSYVRVVDAFFGFGKRFKSAQDHIRFHASIVDTHIPGRRYSGKSGQLGFNREIYYHCLRLGRSDLYRDRIFNVYPDERTTDQAPEQLQGYLCMGIRKHLRGDARFLPYRKVQFRRSHEWQALQVSDILIGAMQYRLNGWFDDPQSNPIKKKLCEYILKDKGKAWGDCIPGKPETKDWGNFRFWMRQHRT